MKSQSGFVTIITSQDITEEAQWCNICEFQSSTISRRVRSTLAAESASLSLALDRHLFARLLVQAFIYGEPEDYTNNWREELLVPGIMTTDAASLYDHLNKTGSIPEERQILIDLLTARDMVEEKIVDLKWCPTTHMLADVLTKPMEFTEVQKRLFYENQYSLNPTTEELQTEERRKENRKNQRERAKVRRKEKKDESFEKSLEDKRGKVEIEKDEEDKDVE